MGLVHHFSCKYYIITSIYRRCNAFDVILNDKGRNSVEQNAKVPDNSTRALLRHQTLLLQSPDVFNQWIAKDQSCDALMKNVNFSQYFQTDEVWLSYSTFIYSIPRNYWEYFSTPSIFPLLTSSANHQLLAASKMLAYQHLSCTVFPPFIWLIIQIYTQYKEKYLRSVITTGNHFTLL